MRNKLANFLLNNGFEEIDQNIFSNAMCIVKIEDTTVKVTDHAFTGVYGRLTRLSLFWLIGILTYYNFIDKNYKI